MPATLFAILLILLCVTLTVCMPVAFAYGLEKGGEVAHSYTPVRPKQ